MVATLDAEIFKIAGAWVLRIELEGDAMINHGLMNFVGLHSIASRKLIITGGA